MIYNGFAFEGVFNSDRPIRFQKFCFAMKLSPRFHEIRTFFICSKLFLPDTISVIYPKPITFAISFLKMFFFSTLSFDY